MKFMNEINFENVIKDHCGCYLIRDEYGSKLTDKQFEIAFNDAIKTLGGSWIMQNCYNRISQEQNNICFNDALKTIGNTRDIFKWSFDKLTPEQIAKCKKKLKITI